MHQLYGNIILAQACIRYDVPQTLKLIGIFSGRIFVVSCIVILRFATMATEIHERRRLNFEIQLTRIMTCFGVACVIPWPLFVKHGCYVQMIHFNM